jgi:RHS repeat-associated protein
LTIFAVKPGNGSADLMQSQQRTAFLPPATQVFTYDLDGNLTSDGVWTYSWDAENRLWAMETTASAIAGGVPARRLEFKYDHMHRRVEKLVRGGWNGSTFTTIVSHHRYLYDGWNLVAEFSVASVAPLTLTLTRSYTWELDITADLTKAGGVGALLQIADHATGKTYLPSYDGNGNIVALFDSATTGGSAGVCVAAYEYSPFGEFLRSEGTYATENPFRFSTKFTDDETGLVYYGRRYYSPSQGRFLGRDRIEEAGGLNLYAFCRNDAINRWDFLGYYADIKLDGNTLNIVIPVYFGTEISKEVKDQIIKNIESQWNGTFDTDTYRSVEVRLSVTVLSELPTDNSNYNIFNVFTGEGKNRTTSRPGTSVDIVTLFTESMSSNTPAHEVGHILGLRDRYVYMVENTITGDVLPPIEPQQVDRYLGSSEWSVKKLPLPGYEGTISAGGDGNVSRRDVQDLLDIVHKRAAPTPPGTRRDIDPALALYHLNRIDQLKRAILGRPAIELFPIVPDGAAVRQ